LSRDIREPEPKHPNLPAMRVSIHFQVGRQSRAGTGLPILAGVSLQAPFLV
jgi:hypothetical protein